ncbi:MAG: TolB family protein [bacterium]
MTITVEVAGSDPLFEGWHELVYVKDQIYTMKPDGKEVRRLTTTAFNDHAASWSPDNERIAFSSDRDGNTEVYVMEAGGKNVRRLTRTRATERAAFWSPDGKRLAFSSDGDGPSEVYVMNADGSSLRCLTRTSE